MGNLPSHGPLTDPGLVLKRKGRKRISKSLLIQSFIESANRPNSTPRSLPSLGGTWYETSSPVYTGRTIPSRQKSSNDPHDPKGLNPHHQIISQKTTTTRRQSSSDDPKAAPYYVVSTTTYYVKSPASSTHYNKSTISTNSRDSRRQRLSYLSESSSNDTSSGHSENMFITGGATTAANTAMQPFINSRSACKRVKYTTINRRKFMTVPGIPYRLVCDEEESDRQVVLHFLLKCAFNGNNVAPVKEILQNAILSAGNTQERPQVLDIACGPGTWILEMATENPDTDFIGIDIHPMFPCTIRPSNASFQQCNVLNGLPFPDNSFDFVHVRMLLMCLTQTQGLKLLAEIRRVLKPDAIVELLDVEYRIQRPGPISDTLINQKLYHHFEDTFQIRLDAAHHLSTSLTRADCGLIDVYQDHVTIPLGSWGGQLGEVHGQNLVTGFIKTLDPDILEAVMNQTMSLSEEKAIAAILEECQKYQSHLNWHVSYGRKPKSMAKATSTTNVKTNSATAPAPGGVPAGASTSVLSDSSATEWDLIRDFVDGYMD